MHQVASFRTPSNAQIIEQAIRDCAERDHGGKVAMVSTSEIRDQLETKGLTGFKIMQEATQIRERMISASQQTISRGRSFTKKNGGNSSRATSKPLSNSSAVFAQFQTRSPSPKPKKKAQPKSIAGRIAAFESRFTGRTVDVVANTPAELGVSKRALTHPDTLTQGLVLNELGPADKVEQGRVEVHPFRWNALGIDPLKDGSKGTTLVIRSRHWSGPDRLEGEGAAFRLSIVGPNGPQGLPFHINPVLPQNNAGVVVLNISDEQLSEVIGGPLGEDINFQIDAAFTDKEKPSGRHTQKAVFNIPTGQKAGLERQRVGWADHETVDINLSRQDGVVAELTRALAQTDNTLPALESMTTMMESEAEFVLPENYDMDTARRTIYNMALNPSAVQDVLGPDWECYPADKYIRKDLKGIAKEEYEALSWAQKAEFWQTTDGIPNTIGHTDTILDTPSQTLLKKGLILRVRANERGTVVSLKSVSQKGASEDSRVRFCADASLPKGTSEEDAIRMLSELLKHRGSDDLDPNPFVQGLEAAGVELTELGLDLKKTLQIESRRDRIRLSNTADSANIELSLDVSRITPYDSAGELLPMQAKISKGFEFGLEHAGVSPRDDHGPKKSPSPSLRPKKSALQQPKAPRTKKAPAKKLISGFRGFHTPEDLSHPSLHTKDSNRNRSLLTLVQDLTPEVFGESTKLSPGGFKAVQGAQDVGLIGGGWKREVAKQELGQDAPKPVLSPTEQSVSDHVDTYGPMGLVGLFNLAKGTPVGQLRILVGDDVDLALGYARENDWVRKYLAGSVAEQV